MPFAGAKFKPMQVHFLWRTTEFRVQTTAEKLCCCRANEPMFEALIRDSEYLKSAPVQLF